MAPEHPGESHPREHSPSFSEAKDNAGLLDFEIIDMLREMDDDDMPGFFDDIVTTYAKTADELIAKLSRAVEAKDCAAIRTEAHSLKGASANVGAAAVAALGKKLEENAKQSVTEGNGALFEELEQIHTRSLAALRDLTKEN